MLEKKNRPHRGHRRDHFLGVPLAEKITRLWRKTQRRRPENFGIELQCDLLQRTEKEAHARASVRPRSLARASRTVAERRTPCEQQTDSTRHVRPRSVRCWRYPARGHLAIALHPMPRASSGAPHGDEQLPARIWGFLHLWLCAAGLKISRPTAKGRGCACTALELARLP